MSAKPKYISHYLVLKDLIDGVDVRKYSDNIVYLCSRIENIKNDLKNRGLHFDETAVSSSRYSHYKPYILMQDKNNIELAKTILEELKTDKIITFIESATEQLEDEVQESHRNWTLLTLVAMILKRCLITMIISIS